MTQPPITPDGTPEPGTQPSPTFGSQTYAAPTQPPAPYASGDTGASFGSQTYPAPAPTKGRKRWGRIGGLVAVVAVIAVKVLAAIGLGGLFHHVEHRAGDAEQVVKAMWTSNGDPSKYFVPGFSFRSLDPGCRAAFTAGGMAKISSSKKESDTTADVTLDPDKGSSIHFHLVDQGSWLIDGCTS